MVASVPIPFRSINEISSTSERGWGAVVVPSFKSNEWGATRLPTCSLGSSPCPVDHRSHGW
eukprot:scaffold11809_cov128-Cylindrotheca_fusiformis.AAC.23